MVIVPVPEIDVVGNVPRSPLSVVAPVLVTPAPARTTKLSAVSSGTDVAAAWAPLTSAISSPAENSAIRVEAEAPKRTRLVRGKYLKSFILDLPPVLQ
jgi:hypothetical protein